LAGFWDPAMFLHICIAHFFLLPGSQSLYRYTPVCGSICH
jgi:hypothetical protein